MATFLNTLDLKNALKDLFKSADKSLTIISPYIKLDEKIRKYIEYKNQDPQFILRIMFGKNEEDKSKSMRNEDLEFFKTFQNVEIYYLENLHAKYYANDYDSIITSMNLHSYSRVNNIEVGVLFKPKTGAALLNKIASGLTQDFNADEQSFLYFYNLYDEANLIFKKTAQKKKKLISLKKEFEPATIEIDKTYSFFQEYDTIQKKESKFGYCIRTREKIPFNMDNPLSKNALKIWKEYSNREYPEKYCHFSGEEANGQTCFAKPVLYKYFKEAIAIQKEIHTI